MLRVEVDFRIQMFEDIELRKTARAPMSGQKYRYNYSIPSQSKVDISIRLLGYEELNI